jgi:hypothetical protein
MQNYLTVTMRIISYEDLSREFGYALNADLQKQILTKELKTAKSVSVPFMNEETLAILNAQLVNNEIVQELILTFDSKIEWDE